MMKRMSRYSRASRLLVLLLCALLLAGMLPSYGALGAANDKGSLTFKLMTDYKRLPEDAKVEYTLYKIGVPDQNNAVGWKFDDAFTLYGDKIIPLKREQKTELQSIVNDLAADIAKGDYNFDYTETKALSNGSVEFTGLPNGIYVGVLTEAPDGLNANASFFTIPSWNADQTELRYAITINDKDTYTGDLTVSKAVVSPYDADRTMTYSFTITLDQADLDQTFKTTTGEDVVFKNGEAHVSVKGGESKTITGLPYGIRYTVTEDDAKGLTPTSTGETGTIALGTTAAFTNTRETGMRYVHNAVTVNKVDDAGQGLSGATFVLYADEAHNKEITRYSGGSFQISTDDAKLSSYLPTEGKSFTCYLVETIPPTGYKVVSEPRKVVITTNVTQGIEDDKYVTVTTYTITIDEQDAATVVNPPDTDVAREDDAVTVTKTDGSQEISGATFTLYDDNKVVRTYTGGEFRISTADAVLKDHLPAVGKAKTLTLKETSVPTGYTGSNAEYTVEITASESTDWDEKHEKLITTTSYAITINDEKSATVVNTPITGDNRKDDAVTVTKTDGSEEISGATFTLYDGNKAVTTFTGGKFEISTANKDLEKVLPAVGKTKTLTLKETGVPTGYTGSSAEYTVEITAKKETAWNSDHTKLVATTIYSITINGGGTLTVPNEPITGSDVEHHNVTVRKVDGSNRALRGAEFTLYSGKTEIAKYGGATIDSFTISTNEKVLAKYLPKVGESVTLTLKETKAPTGYSLSSKEYKVVLSTKLVTKWNSDHTKLITTTVYDITIDDSASVTVENNLAPTPTPAPGGGGGGGGGVPVPPAPTATPSTEISGTKIWVDDNNAHGVRPGSIEVTLYADGSPVSATPTWTKTGNHWTYTFGDLPKVDENGNEITYTVQESPVNYYESTVSGMVITNRLIPREPERYIDLSGQKIWNDDDNASGQRPTSITVRLLRDGVEIDSRVVTAGTNWSYTFQHLPTDDGYGNTYTYEVREDGVNGYFSRIDGTTVTNSLINGSVPPPPTPDGETPPPDGTVPERPEDIPDRHTGTPVPHFEGLTDEEMEELFDMFGYGTPLYGMLGTGDQVPAWVWACGAIGILALAMVIVMGRKKKKAR